MPVKNSPPPEHQIDWGPSPSAEEILPSPSPIPVDFSPPLIAMVVIVATAFFIVTYFRLISRHLLPPIILLFQRSRHRWIQWRHHHRRRQSFIPSLSDIESPPPPLFDSAFHFLGLEDEAIRTIPLSVYTKKRKSFQDCAVCLLEFEQNDYVRTLPICSHDFHVDCIDIWLRSHANCPLCRAGIFRATDSPFIPLMASRVRPSLDEGILQSILLERTESEEETTELRSSLDEIISPRQNNNNNNNNDNDQQEERRDFFLKRSYSFGFERNLPADRIVLEAATATPWRYRRGSGFWNKHQSRSSPFMARPRVFSFRYMKSPFFRQRRGERSRFFPLSESNARFSGGGGGGGSSRRSKSMTSPMFLRSSLATANMAMFSSSRMRCGDLDALLSPERFNRR